jgi:hypothetical protein
VFSARGRFVFENHQDPLDLGPDPRWITDESTSYKQYLTVNFAHKPNIIAQIWLTVFAPGLAQSIFTSAITNIGQMPATIPMSVFWWKVPLERKYWLITPWDYA